jgi:DNA-binding transcriptional ArsR family regulator
MDYQVICDSAPAYELIISLYQFIHHKQLKHGYLDSAWHASARSRLTASFASELADERWEVLHRINLLVWQCPGERTPEQFLAWLSDQAAGDIYERLAPWADALPGNLREIRDRAVYLLSEWNRQYFAQLPAAIFESLNRDLEQKKQLAASLAPADLVEEAANGLRIEPVDGLKTVYLIPQFHCQPYTIVDFNGSICTCLYPARSASPLFDTPLRMLLDTTQALADANRLAILRLLANAPCSFTDIQQHIGLAKSTTSHHLALLRLAGLIRSHFFGSTTVQQYSLRTEGLNRLKPALCNYLFGEESAR